MSRRSTILIVVAAFLLLGLSLIGYYFFTPQTVTSVAQALFTTKEIRVGETELVVEVADTTATRARGLSGRDSLPSEQGMLFVFEVLGRPEFWMREMRFSLDFVWIRDGVVVQLNSDIPAPSPEQPDPIRLSPGQEVDMVLELPAGWIVAHGITLGAKVEGL